VPSWVSLAVVKVFGFKDLINRFASANIIEGFKFESSGSKDLSVGQAANLNGSTAVTSHRILRMKCKISHTMNKVSIVWA
jgi:hypothetical protein